MSPEPVLNLYTTHECFTMEPRRLLPTIQGVGVVVDPPGKGVRTPRIVVRVEDGRAVLPILTLPVRISTLSVTGREGVFRGPVRSREMGLSVSLSLFRRLKGATRKRVVNGRGF